VIRVIRLPEGHGRIRYCLCANTDVNFMTLLFQELLLTMSINQVCSLSIWLHVQLVNSLYGIYVSFELLA